MSNASHSAPTPSLRRLPQYLRLLRTWAQQGRTTVSCTSLAEELGQDPTQVRKDLAITGIVGKPKVGYDLVELAEAIERFLGWNSTNRAVLVGAGNLGLALLGYSGFQAYGLEIVAAFDSNPQKTEYAGKKIFSLSKLPAMARRLKIRLGILAVPQNAAVEAANMMVDCGILAVLNFTSVRLHLPEQVIVEEIDLAQNLAVLSHQLAAKKLT